LDCFQGTVFGSKSQYMSNATVFEVPTDYQFWEEQNDRTILQRKTYVSLSDIILECHRQTDGETELLYQYHMLHS